MAKYDGIKCISCGEIFKDGDDVVVCPECGTPYHRECYLKEGSCINTELHEKNESWSAFSEENNDGQGNSDEPIRCIRCGETNPPDGIFCTKCGTPLTHQSGEERPFNVPPQYNNGNQFGQNGNPYTQNSNGNFGNYRQMTFDQDSDIDGVKLGDYTKYVGRNPLIILSNFIRFGRFGGKASINIGALFFPQFYFFYRKMPAIGSLFMLLSIIFAIPSIIYTGQTGVMGTILLNTHFDVSSNAFNTLYNVSNLLSMVLRCFAAVFANYIYYKSARKNILKIRSAYSDGDSESVSKEITARGGVSFPALGLAFIVYLALETFVMYVLNALA